MSSTDLHPIGPDLLRHNRRVMAERIGWPDGALEACDKLEAAYPDWIVGWQRESTITGFARPAGFYASRWSRRYNEPSAYGEDPLDLAVAIETWMWQGPFGLRRQ
jgi:hypothetical protein